MRIIFKKRIFEPSDDHFHHQIIKITNNIYYTNLISVSANILFGFIGLLIFKKFGAISSILTYPLLFLVFFYLKFRLYKKIKKY